MTGDTFLNIHIKCSRLSYPTSSQIAGIELSEFPGNAETGQLLKCYNKVVTEVANKI